MGRKKYEKITRSLTKITTLIGPGWALPLFTQVSRADMLVKGVDNVFLIAEGVWIVVWIIAYRTWNIDKKRERATIWQRVDTD